MNSRNVGLVAVIALGIPVLLLLLAPLVYAPERLRQDLQDLALTRAGLELGLAQPAHFQLLPRPALLLEGITLHLADGAAPEGAPVPLLQVRRLHASLQILPLLLGQVRLAHVELQHPVLHLVKNARGLWNWQHRDSTPLPDAQGSAPAGPLAVPDLPLVPDLGPLRGVDLHLVQGRVFVADLGSGATLDVGRLDGRVHAAFQAGTLRLEPLALTCFVRGSALPWQEPAPLTLSLDLELAPAEGRVRLQNLDATLWGVSLAGSLQNRGPWPDLAGALRLDAPLAAVQRLLGQPSPREAQDLPQERVQGSLRFELQPATPQSPAALLWPELRLELVQADEAPTPVHGRGRLLLGHPPRLELDLDGKALDLGPLLRLSGSEDRDTAPLPLPGALLAAGQGLDLDLSLELGALRLDEYLATPLQDLHLRTDNQAGALTLRLLARPGQGRFSGELRANLLVPESLAAPPAVQANLHLTLEEADLESLAALPGLPLPDDQPAGAVDLRLELGTQGADWAQLLAALQGTLRLQVAGAPLSGTDPVADSREFRLLEGSFVIEGLQEDTAAATP